MPRYLLSPFHKQWLFPIEVVVPAAIEVGSPNAAHNNEAVQETIILIAKFLETEPLYGDNPEIFYYSYKVNAESPGYILRMVFYGGIEISAISTLADSTPLKTA